MPIEDLVDTARQQFHERFGRRPRWIVAAPGRVNMIGEHTDYNDGFVLPMAIDRYVVMAADQSYSTPAADGTIEANVFSTDCDDAETIRINDRNRPEGKPWSRYVQGVLVGCIELGLMPVCFDSVVHSDVPSGGGLSSSAALEVATATLIESMAGTELDPVQKALLCQKAEHDYAGVPCGIMDQFCSVLAEEGHLLLLDCRTRQCEQVPFSDPDVSVLIMNSNVKHELAGGEYALRRASCERAAGTLGVSQLRDVTLQLLEDRRATMDEVDFRRARHVVTEIDRTILAAEKFRAGDWPAVGELMYASHTSLRHDFEVSCKELDALVELMQIGSSDGTVIGSRMTGGGFGGCTVSIVKSAAVDEISARVRRQYQERTNIEPTIFVTRPSSGAFVVES